MIARGFRVKYVAKKLNITESRIYHLLNDKNSPVNAEINRILNDLFATTDRRLMILYDKALQKLDDMLSSSDEEKQYRAMDRIIKMFFGRTAKNAIIQQYFCAHPLSQQLGSDIDALIMQKRRDRGLEPPVNKDSSDSPPEASPPNASPPEASPPEASPPNAPAPNAPAPNNSLDDPSSPEYKAFINLLRG
jgi:transcriptional regulator with XRE-family HTH domain